MGKAIEFVKINKRFPGVHVLKDISFSVEEGEVHALLGENGAGKSTLLNILHGVYGEYEGSVLLHGKEVHFKSANDAIKNGNISKVHQEIMVVEELSVGQNVTMGYEPKKGAFIDFNKMHNDVDAILTELNCNFKSRDIVRTLTAGQKQMIAIAKAIYHHSNIISFDEPTASLTSKETEALFAVIEKLKKDGITILYVSHHLEEIFQICDRATILRDGEFVQTHSGGGGGNGLGSFTLTDGDVVGLAVAGRGGQPNGFQHGVQLLRLHGTAFVIGPAGLPGLGNFQEIHRRTSLRFYQFSTGKAGMQPL